MDKEAYIRQAVEKAEREYNELYFDEQKFNKEVERLTKKYSKKVVDDWRVSEKYPETSVEQTFMFNMGQDHLTGKYLDFKLTIRFDFEAGRNHFWFKVPTNIKNTTLGKFFIAFDEEMIGEYIGDFLISDFSRIFGSNSEAVRTVKMLDTMNQDLELLFEEYPNAPYVEVREVAHKIFGIK